jgi:hypothetical protein
MPKNDGTSTNPGCAFSARHPERGSLGIPPDWQSRIVFPCRNFSSQKDLQPVYFGVTGLGPHGGMDVAPVVFIGPQQGKENGSLGKKLTQLHATSVAAGVLTGSAWFSSDGVCPPPGQEGVNKAADPGGTIPGTSTADGQKVVFWKDVYPILERSCRSCHGPKKQQGDFRVDRREDFFGKGGSTPLVAPGKSAESRLLAIVSGLRRDLPRADVHQLPAPQVAILRAWIDAGAPWLERPGHE